MTNEKEDNVKRSDENKRGNDFLGNDVSFMESQSTPLVDANANKADNSASNNIK